jgi:hypothetical protein
MKQIILNYSLGLDANEIVKLYKDATKIRFNFFKIDVETRYENKRYSHNFNDFYKINDESESDEDEK